MRDFNDVDINDPDEDPGAKEAAAFYQRMDWEGGLTGLLEYDGGESDLWPEPLRVSAKATAKAIEDLKEMVKDWAAIRGVRY